MPVPVVPLPVARRAPVHGEPPRRNLIAPLRGARRRRARTALAAVLVAWAAFTALAPPPSGAAADTSEPAESRGAAWRTSTDAGEDAEPYGPPVQRPVVDPFRPPAAAYGPGNRGLEYDTVAGDPIGAIGPGSVTFVGSVAGALHVTVMHPDGLRSSYSFLASATVVAGQQVVTGATVGTAGERFHLGVRRGDEYLDPAALFGGSGALATPSLVPISGEAPAVTGERGILAALTRLELPALPAGGSALLLDWLSGTVASAHPGSDPLLHELSELLPGPHLDRFTATVREWVAAQASCSTGLVPSPPAERRIAVLVGGLGSSSSDAAIDTLDTGALGYAAADVLRLSYAGGAVPSEAGAPAHLGIGATSHYGPESTLVDVHRSAAVLRDLLAGVRDSNPGVPVDVYAHSLGGVVARVALAGPSAHAAADVVGHLVTIGAPHSGTDLATAAAAVGESGAGEALLGVLRSVGVSDPTSPAIRQMAETSDLSAGLGSAAFPTGVAVLALGASGDLVVPAGHTALPGQDHFVVGALGVDAHDRLPALPEVRDEVLRHLGGQAPSCEDLGQRLRKWAMAEGIAAAEDGLGAALALATR